MRQASEPSVEEILDSIKKVIARDNRAGAAVERKQREERGLRAVPAAAEEPEEDVFELDASAELADESEQEEPLLPEGRASSMRESLAALAMLAEPGMAPQIVRSGETSLEGMTRELLRPALALWLDQNLPPLVERLVSAEIARIVGKKG
jgi:uncharacterized protein